MNKGADDHERHLEELIGLDSGWVKDGTIILSGKLKGGIDLERDAVDSLLIITVLFVAACSDRNAPQAVGTTEQQPVLGRAQSSQPDI